MTGNGVGEALKPFDPERLLRVLTRHEVRFVLIGGWAGRLQGSPSVTVDLDICYDRRPDNLDALAAALAELDVRLRGAPEGVTFHVDARALGAGDMFTLSTQAGDLDLLGNPAGVGGYDDLVAHAHDFELDDLRVRVCSIDDLIRMKRAAGRPKDMVEIRILMALKEEVDRA